MTRIRMKVHQLCGSHPKNTIRIDEKNTTFAVANDDGLYICTSIFSTRRNVALDMNLEPEIECLLYDASGKIRYTKISTHTAIFAATGVLAIPIKIHKLSALFPDWKTKLRVIELRIVFRERGGGSTEPPKPGKSLSAA